MESVEKGERGEMKGMVKCLACKEVKPICEYPVNDHTRPRRCLYCVAHPLPKLRKKTAVMRLAEKVKVAENGCWLWTGTRLKDGYGLIWVDGKNVFAHRFAYQISYGPIPEGMEIDHTCHGIDQSCAGGPSCIHRPCVNPSHLEAVPHHVNILRGRLWLVSGGKTHCPHGHPYIEGNIYRTAGERRCRLCSIAASRKQREKRKMA